MARSSASAAVASFALALTLLLGVGPARAAGPLLIGQAGYNEAGGCDCVVAQFGVNSGTAYDIPSAGVLTTSEFYVGENTVGTDEWVRAGAYHRSGVAGLTETSRGAKHMITGLVPGLYSYWERVPVAAGEVLGARYHTSGYILATPRAVSTTSESDKAGFLTGEATLGSPFTASLANKYRANVAAVLEPDEDGDGYGDSSQDLCLGSPIGTAACTGTLLGSDLQGQRTGLRTACGGGDCMRVQTKINGVSTAAQSDGVVVRWRVMNGETGAYHARVVVPNPAGSGGMYIAYRVLHSSAPGNVTSPTGPLFSKISTFETRLPIPAGAYVGLAMPSAHTEAFQASSGAATFTETNDGGDGIGVVGTSYDGTILYDADVEPDADHDGYGDITQDACPTDPATQGACPPAAAAPGSTGGGAGGKGGGSGGNGSSSRPTVTAFKAAPASFHLDEGAKLKLRLSAAARITFIVQAELTCHQSSRRCKPLKNVATFSKQLRAGANKVPFPGTSRKLMQLAPGSYRIAATPTTPAGKGRAVTVTVLP